jgi:hypothetical protein
MIGCPLINWYVSGSNPKVTGTASTAANKRYPKKIGKMMIASKESGAVIIIATIVPTKAAISVAIPLSARRLGISRTLRLPKETLL